ncbi:MAG: hypothetical protein Q4F06_09405 [Eubacteriales bacterium]|nr:hypothetical protein [Eubacteriales bacterium]
MHSSIASCTIRKDITTETTPLFNAVKKDEPNMSNPLIKMKSSQL